MAGKVEHAMTFKILTDETKKGINNSNVRSTGLRLEYNIRLGQWTE